MAQPIRAGGIASGIDTNGLIQSLINSARRPIQLLQVKRRDFQSQQSIFRDINSRLESLGSQAEDLKTNQDFLTLSASTTDSDKLTAAADGNARAGTYLIDVQQLATTHQARSSTLGTSAASSVSSGDTFTITVNGEAKTVTVDDDGATLAQIAGYINDDASDLVNATIITNPVTSQDTLFIESKSSGTDGAITFADTSGTALQDVGIIDGGGAIVNEVTAAQDAILRIGGAADGVTVNTSSNSPSDVIDGVTLNLLETTGGTDVTVTVEPDKDAIIDKVEGLVSAYNNVINRIKGQFQIQAGAAARSSLQGDSTIRRIKSELQNIISSTVEGLTSDYNALSRIGVKSDREGVLSVDTTELGDAIDADFSAVAAIFVEDEDANTQGVASQLFDAIDGYTDGNGDFIAGWADPLEGVIANRIDGIDDVIASIDTQIDRMELRIQSQEESLVERFTNMELAVARIQQQGAALGRI